MTCLAHQGLGAAAGARLERAGLVGLVEVAVEGAEREARVQNELGLRECDGVAGRAALVDRRSIGSAAGRVSGK